MDIESRENSELLNIKVSRRGFLKSSGIGTVGIATLITAGCGKEMEKSIETDISPITVNSLSSKIDSLNAQGIIESENEALLWPKEKFIPNEVFSQSPAQVDQILRPKFGSLVKKMIQSENPYFTESGTMITEMINDETILIRILPADKRGFIMSVGPSSMNERTRKVQYSLLLFTNSSLRNFDHQMVAVTLVHEMHHIKDHKKYLEPFIMSGGTSEQIEKKYAEYFYNPTNCIDREAIAYARESEAYAYQKALVPSFYYGDQELKATDYYRLGAQADNLEWRKLVNQVANCQG